MLKKGGCELELPFLPPQLMFFHGILAVGTQGGHVHLVDLALDTHLDRNEELVPCGEDDGDPHFSCESCPAELRILDGGAQQGQQNLADLRLECLRRGQHLAVELNRVARSENKGVRIEPTHRADVYYMYTVYVYSST